jgi:hypothetical protein
MNSDQYKDRISAQLANAALNQVIASFAEVAAERDALAAELAALKAEHAKPVESAAGA